MTGVHSDVRLNSLFLVMHPIFLMPVKLSSGTGPKFAAQSCPTTDLFAATIAARAGRKRLATMAGSETLPPHPQLPPRHRPSILIHDSNAPPPHHVGRSTFPRVSASDVCMPLKLHLTG
jgi:hypothetical protein